MNALELHFGQLTISFLLFKSFVNSLAHLMHLKSNKGILTPIIITVLCESLLKILMKSQTFDNNPLANQHALL